ncbi:hypothetical protein NKG95_27960 [Mesorhizobium sp. M1423]|uniref:hypothetical protein n=1 Tax=Mesorhizobium sp. M1423 TaxID=2957101 RepID=UPI00333ACC6A
MTNEFTPKFDLAGKVVLVTGASRGIGGSGRRTAVVKPGVRLSHPLPASQRTMFAVSFP